MEVSARRAFNLLKELAYVRVSCTDEEKKAAERLLEEAKACGVEAAGIPAHTTRVSQMINHFMREVAGVWHYILLGGQYSD